MMAIEAARRLRNDTVCFVGIGLPSLAANLARRTHAPECVLIYESGTIGAKPFRIPLSIGDGELAETADAVVSVPEMFNYWILEVMEPRDGELTLTALHPGTTVDQVREATGWEVRVADELAATSEPSDAEPSALGELIARG